MLRAPPCTWVIEDILRSIEETRRGLKSPWYEGEEPPFCDWVIYTLFCEKDIVSPYNYSKGDFFFRGNIILAGEKWAYTKRCLGLTDKDYQYLNSDKTLEDKLKYLEELKSR